MSRPHQTKQSVSELKAQLAALNKAMNALEKAMDRARRTYAKAVNVAHNTREKMGTKGQL